MRRPFFGFGLPPPHVRREPIVDAPPWLWDPELEAYILVREDIEWTEGFGPTPIVLPPTEPP